MNPEFTFTAQLNAPVKASTLMPYKEPETLFIEPDSYMSLHRLVSDFPIPIYISPKDNYLLLEDIVFKAHELIPTIDYFIIDAQMPGCSRIPKRLLAADVLFVNDMDTDRDILLNEGFSVLTINNGLVRSIFEIANNTIALSLFSVCKTSSLCEKEQWSTVCNTLLEWGFISNE